MATRLPIALTVLALAVLALALGPAGEAGSGASPGASAQAFAVKVAAPGQPDVSTQIVSAPPDASSFGDAYATTGVSTGALSAAATTLVGESGVATGASSVEKLSLFGDEITADAATASAKASAGPGAAAGDLSGSAVTNLVVLGQAVQPSPNLKVQLADWGTLTVLAQGSDTSAPAGAHGYRGFVAALDVHLTQDHGGLPAGTEILVAYAEAAAQTAPAPPATTSTAPTTTAPLPAPPANEPFSPHHLTHPPGFRGTAPKAPRPHGPPKVRPPLDAGPYVFPVFGPASYVDTFGGSRSDIASGWHHGTDVFGQVGQPVLAVTDGTVFSVGWNRIGGNRLWLRDGRGNQFYYAHLAAFSSLAVDGAQVHAGDVLGFMGDSGDAAGTPYHLHFEIHPVGLLYRGYDGAVDPETYLERWRKLQDVEFPGGAAWAPLVHGHGNAPDPGAVLLQVSDISQAAGLDPASLRRANVAQRSG